MKQIQILGTGCTKCNNLTANAEAAAKATGEPYTIEKITDIRQIMTFGVMTTPALVIDGKVVASGKVPSIDEVSRMLGS
ncbi:MAG: thioredoxin family protein [Luteolibacter sp.]